jgi:superfamily II DNA or RNA helicase
MSEGDGRGANGLSERIMADLKDFQRDTVNYVFRRLYKDKDTARRFLIASETGLGKTLIARGVIARVIDHLQGQTA